MSTLNKIILVGNLLENPDIRVTTSGDALAKFTLSVERPGRGEGFPVQSDILDVVAWRQTADSVKPLTKGQAVLVEGRIITRTLDDNNGQRKYITEVEAREIRGLGQGQSYTQQEEVSAYQNKKSTLTPAQSEPIDEFDFGEGALKESDLQFPPGFDKEIEEEIPF